MIPDVVCLTLEDACSLLEKASLQWQIHKTGFAGGYKKKIRVLRQRLLREDLVELIIAQESYDDLVLKLENVNVE